MSMDITHCSGELCPIKDRCRRHDYFKKIENQRGVKNYSQNSSFMTPPYNHKKKSCEMFWGEHSNIIFEQLKKILGIKNVSFGQWKKKKKRKKIGYKLSHIKKKSGTRKEKALWLSLSKNKKK